MFGKAEIDALRTELAAAQQRIAELEADRRDRSRRDPRTNLLVLDAFREAAARELERARRNGRPVSLALVDIDGFRVLNGHRGPEAGNAALNAVATRISRLTRTNDVLARTGADEFAVLLPDTRADGARLCCERLIAELEEAEVPGAGYVSVSAGVAAHVRGGTIDRLLATAAEGLERARRAGGGRVASTEMLDPEDAPEDPHNDVIEALATALLERDRYTGEHSESVVAMAKRVAYSLGLDPVEVTRVGAAALLHDIGKVAIPDHILNKPAKLSEEEWALMREHPVIGERILRAIPGMGGVARIVRHEHESFDGSGYPDGLRGEEIPIGSRIILACDTYHAMTSDRPYRARMPHADAVRELARCAGTQFDPKVTEALIGYLYQAKQAGVLVET
jgi:diguanylate cyclase (GGDEF)-like protein/putative nucleotidyltransferase with HDIG domain